MEGQETTVVEFNSKKPSFSAPFVMYSNLRKYRELMKHFVKRDLKIRYHNSIIGYGWSVIEPLSLTVTFYVLFAILSDDTDPYRPLTILLGLLAWALFAKTFSTGTYSIQRNASLIKRVYFPREIFLFSKCGYQIIHTSLSLFVIIPLLIIYDLVPNERILLLPVAIIFISMLALGLSFITSILQTRARDVEHIVNIFIRISFYLTPVFYPLDMITGGRIPEEYASVYLIINPMATYITMVRSAFTGDSLGIPLENLAFTFGITIIVFWIGSIYFLRKERKAVKYI